MGGLVEHWIAIKYIWIEIVNGMKTVLSHNDIKVKRFLAQVAVFNTITILERVNYLFDGT